MTLPDLLATLSALFAFIGVAQAIAGWLCVRRFARRIEPPRGTRPPITVLKPLHGDEPMLEEALATLCAHDYPIYQVVCGVQNPDDPAISVVRRLQTRFPDCDIALVIDPTDHGPNRKIGNLINMFPMAKHDVLAIADSDLHVRPDYLSDLAATLAQPGCGLVTTLYTGLPASGRLPALLGASQITHGFLPGAVLARAMGRQDCLGATMCLRRETLMRIGGLPALVDHLADDNVLGQLVRSLGLDVRLAATVVATTVPEATWGALFRHELRWARTIRALVPGAFAASVLQYPIFWALIAVAASAGAPWAIGLFVLAWLGRAFAATGIDRALAGKAEMLAFPGSVGFLPLRELLSVSVLLASYAGKRVDWRGHTMHAAGFTASDAPVVKGLHKR
jgi:ceramide glucosyltransferase